MSMRNRHPSFSNPSSVPYDTLCSCIIIWDTCVPARIGPIERKPLSNL